MGVLTLTILLVKSMDQSSGAHLVNSFTQLPRQDLGTRIKCFPLMPMNSLKNVSIEIEVALACRLEAQIGAESRFWRFADGSVIGT